jgi:hypothetical protein
MIKIAERADTMRGANNCCNSKKGSAFAYSKNPAIHPNFRKIANPS